MKNNKKTGIALLGIFALFYASGIVSDLMLTCTVYPVHTEKQGSGRIRIVNVSDLHNKRFGKKQNRLISKVKSLSPDIIIITGDLAEGPEAENAYDFIREAKNIAPVYYSCGNHEARLSPDRFSLLMSRLADLGAVILGNETVTVTCGGNSINLIGLKDQSLGNDTLKELCDSCGNSLFTAVLAHEPQYFEKYASCGCDLVFCGHAHGGQIRLPFAGGVFAPSQGLFPKYSEGIHTKNGTSMIVSRGIANNAPFPRFFNPPEIAAADIILEAR